MIFYKSSKIWKRNNSYLIEIIKEFHQDFRSKNNKIIKMSIYKNKKIINKIQIYKIYKRIVIIKNLEFKN